MSRYIDADALREKWLCLQGHDFSPSSFVYSIDNAPIVDAVPVVRCGECNYAREIIGGVRLDGSTIWCNHIGQYTNNDWFCADGERKEGAE